MLWTSINWLDNHRKSILWYETPVLTSGPQPNTYQGVVACSHATCKEFTWRQWTHHVSQENKPWHGLWCCVYMILLWSTNIAITTLHCSAGNSYKLLQMLDLPLAGSFAKGSVSSYSSKRLSVVLLGSEGFGPGMYKSSSPRTRLQLWP